MADEQGSPLPIAQVRQRGLYFRVRRCWDRLFELQPWIADDRAEGRSIQLLEENLSPVQRRQYERHRCFEVIGGSTGTRYRIRHGYQMNVEQLDRSGKRVRMLCFMPEGRLGVGDIMLAQKLALELFEDEAIKAANKML